MENIDESLDDRVSDIASSISRWLAETHMRNLDETSVDEDVIEEMKEARDHAREALVLIHED